MIVCDKKGKSLEVGDTVFVFSKSYYESCNRSNISGKFARVALMEYNAYSPWRSEILIQFRKNGGRAEKNTVTVSSLLLKINIMEMIMIALERKSKMDLIFGEINQ